MYKIDNKDTRMMIDENFSSDFYILIFHLYT